MRNTHFLFFLLISAVGLLPTLAQNMLLNGNFEQLVGGNPAHWSLIANTPDFTAPKKGLLSHTDSMMKGGKWCMGLVATAGGGGEKIQGTLAAPLKKGKKYKITLYCFDKGNKPLNYISIGLFAKPVNDDFLTRNFEYEYIILRPVYDSILNVKDKWMKVQTVYTAKGGEKYLILGNLREANKEVFEPGNPFIFPYYFYDNISLIDIEPDTIPQNGIAEKIETPIKQEILPQKEATTSPKGIYFDTDKYALRELSFQVLDEWAELLHQNPTWKMEISGHTDAEGNNRSNQILAQNRINSVVNYLISKGVEKKRMSMINFAAAKPAASNETENGKQLNRRVEIKIIDK